MVTRLGALQACLIRDALKAFPPPELVLMSPQPRALQSTIPTLDSAGKEVPNKEDDRLGDFMYLDPVLYIQKTSKDRGPSKIAYWQALDSDLSIAEGAESFSHFISRVKDFISDIAQRPEETIYVFTHGYFIKAVEIIAKKTDASNQELMRLFREDEFEKIRENEIVNSSKHIKNGEIVEIDVDSDGTMKIVKNHRDHLDRLKGLNPDTATLKDIRLPRTPEQPRKSRGRE